jgi:hypothetical protein
MEREECVDLKLVVRILTMRNHALGGKVLDFFLNQPSLTLSDSFLDF